MCSIFASTFSLLSLSPSSRLHSGCFGTPELKRSSRDSGTAIARNSHEDRNSNLESMCVDPMEHVDSFPGRDSRSPSADGDHSRNFWRAQRYLCIAEGSDEFHFECSCCCSAYLAENLRHVSRECFRTMRKKFSDIDLSSAETMGDSLQEI